MCRRGGADRAVSLLVRESIPAAEELLPRQPVVGDVAGLPADQVVGHDVHPPTTTTPDVLLRLRGDQRPTAALLPPGPG